MGGASSFYAMLAICGFLSAAWTATKISKLIGISSIVLEIATGVLLGPQVLGLINSEYAQCEHQRHSECEPPADLYHRIAEGLPLGETMGRIANMEYCDLHGYLEKEGRLELMDGHGSGHGSGPVDHRDPCGDGAHVNGFYVWNVSLGNGSMARYHCKNGTLVQEEFVHPASDTLSGSDDTVVGTEAPSTTAAAAPSSTATPAATSTSAAATSVSAALYTGQACMEAVGCNSSACLMHKTSQELLPCSPFFILEACMEAVGCGSVECLLNKTEEALLPCAGSLGPEATTTQMVIRAIANGTDAEATTTQMVTRAITNGTGAEATATEMHTPAILNATEIEATTTLVVPSSANGNATHEEATTTVAAVPSAVHNATQAEATTTVVAPSAVHNATTAEATTTEIAGHTTDQEATTTDVAGHTTDLEVNESGAESPDEDAEGAGNAAADDQRRLSGGGGGIKYDTYAECLEKSCEADVSHHCSLTPDVFTLIGHAGVALMIFESGMHFDFEKAREVGLPACVVAVIGTILPLISGSLVVMAFGKPFLPDGISAGTALAPTSVGISLRLLGEAGVLQENFGQAIITAAFVDDILSLVLFNVLFSLGGDFDIVTTVVFPIVGIVFMICCMLAAVKFWPTVIDTKLMPMVPDERDDLATGLNRIRLTKDEVLFLVMMVLLVVYALITHLLGTHLWGCFMAGMSFACLTPAGHAHHVWVKQTKRMTTWMIRIFFACTVAFSIPVADLMSINAFWKGTIMGIGPCITTKVLCALFMGPPRFVIGWAMVGRAEFAYLIAQMAASANMIDEETFSICIWALLYATIFAPFTFRYLLNRYIRQYGLGGSKAPLADAEDPVEEHGTLHMEEKRGSRRDFSSPGDRLRDLEDIKFSEPEDAMENNRAPATQAMEESGEEDVFALPAKSMVKPRGGEKVRKGQHTGNGIFPGAGDKSSGFLCCLFFRRIVEN